MFCDDREEELQDSLSNVLRGKLVAPFQIRVPPAVFFCARGAADSSSGKFQIAMLQEMWWDFVRFVATFLLDLQKNIDSVLLALRSTDILYIK